MAESSRSFEYYDYVHIPSTHSFSTSVCMLVVFNPIQHKDNSKIPTKSTFPQCVWINPPILNMYRWMCILTHRAPEFPSAFPCKQINVNMNSFLYVLNKCINILSFIVLSEFSTFLRSQYTPFFTFHMSTIAKTRVCCQLLLWMIFL